MTSAVFALVIGTLLAVGALAYVLYPIFFVSAAPPLSKEVVAASPTSWTDDISVAALREIEFDRVTGKLSDSDYAQLKERYTREALAHMRSERSESAASATEGAEDELEAVIRAYRAQRPVCTVCGPRPENDAAFCSECGQYLAGSCQQCGRSVEERGARFCSACGHRLAA